MTEFSVQVENLAMLREALKSSCDRIRFGSEFCEYKMPSVKTLEEAYALTTGGEKGFVYVTPRVSDSGIERIREHLAFLNKVAKIRVVVNDLGVLNMMGQYGNLRPHLGRQLIYIPARCPWEEITEHEVGFLTRRRVEKIFYQTSLNYLPAVDFFKGCGAQGVDVDWIPNCFPHFDVLAKNGLSLSVHLHFVPVTTTRRCHTARFLGEKELETCSKPCYTKAFTMKNELLSAKLVLHGNTVFRKAEPSRKDAERLFRSKVAEFVFTMMPTTEIDGKQGVDSLIRSLQSWG